MKIKYDLKISFSFFIFYLFICILNVNATDLNRSILRSATTGLHSFASSSVLSEGKWVKIKITETGIYKLTYEDLVNMGFSKPSQVQFYGYGGHILDENFSLPKIDDLPHIPVWVEKGNDNVFNAGDYILFYAKGAVKWSYDNSKKEFVHTNNPYSDYGYYFITENDTPTKQMAVNPFNDSFVQELTTFDDYSLHEKDLENIGKTGREFYGESFTFNTSQNFTFNTAGITSDNGLVCVNFIAKATSATPVTVKINNENELVQTMAAGSSSTYERAKEVTVRGEWNDEKKETNVVNVTYGASGHTNARLNYIRLNYKRHLKSYSAYTFFRNVSAINTASKYIFSGANTQTKIWNITDGEQVVQVETKTSGNSVYFSSNSTSLQEFVAVDLSKKDQFPKPEIVGEVKNQNLHALSQTDMVIITHPDFTDQANRVAELRRTNDNLRVHVIETEDIYNEFSSGNPDATAYRWLMKMFYDRGKKLGDENELPQYLLLFGAGTFDNKLILDIWKNRPAANKVLTFQTTNSLVETNSYVVDDYFGFLDDNEGVSLQNDGIDVGIGRFPVKTKEEAIEVTDKLIKYVTNPIYGTWKNNVCFVADDNSGSETNFIHMTQADDLVTDFMEKNNKEFIVNKIYLQTFQKVTNASGYNYPDATKKLHNLLTSGVLMVNYTGHGSTTSWASELVYTSQDAQTLHVTRLPLFVTATCDFTRFDDYATSAGEYVFLNPTGGGIALFSTSRVVYSDGNFAINKEFCKYIFSKTSEGKRLRLGDIMRLSKRNLKGNNNKLSFILIGDPALTLAYPEYHAEITTINGKNVQGEEEQEPQTFSAGSQITLTGHILNPDGSKSTDFNGLAYLTLFDNEELLIHIKVNEKERDIFDRSNILFSGKESVVDGEFSFSFIMPKDMSYSYDPGRMNLYAVDMENMTEAQGHYENFLIGGTDEVGVDDNEPPAITNLYLNHPDFKTGDVVNATPIFYADVEDNTGINIVGTAIGHDATIIIDNSPYLAYNLNAYFETEVGNPAKGTFKFSIPRLSAGKHTLFFRVWDIMNNSTTHSIEFEVQEDLSPRIFDLYAFPNPAKDATSFYIKHDRPESTISVKIDLYSLTGQHLWTHQESGYSETFNAVPIVWDLKTSDGQRIPSGVYVYRATLSSDGSEESTEAKKLIILGQ